MNPSSGYTDQGIKLLFLPDVLNLHFLR